MFRMAWLWRLSDQYSQVISLVYHTRHESARNRKASAKKLIVLHLCEIKLFKNWTCSVLAFVRRFLKSSFWTLKTYFKTLQTVAVWKRTVSFCLITKSSAAWKRLYSFSIVPVYSPMPSKLEMIGHFELILSTCSLFIRARACLGMNIISTSCVY